MRIVSANLKYGMNETQLRHAGKLLAKRAGIVGGQEIRGKKIRLAVLDGLGITWRSVGDRSESPIFFRSDLFQVLDRKVTLATTGIGGITPNLYIVRAHFRDKRNGREFVVYNTHLVPLSLDGKKRPQYALRSQLWRAHWIELVRQVGSDVAAGRTVYVMGDFNNLFAKQLVHPQAQWITQVGLDWLQVIRPKRRPRKPRTFSFATGSDHRAVGVGDSP